MRKIPKRKNKLKRLNIMLGMFLIFANVIFACSIFAVSHKIDQTQLAIEKQTNKNQSLTMKINELASPENVQLVAQNLGLEYNNNNIVTVTD